MGWPEVCRPNQPIFVKYLMLGISNFFNCIADEANWVFSEAVFYNFKKTSELFTSKFLGLILVLTN